MWKRWLRDQSGATAIEYGMIAGLLVVAIIGSVSAVGSSNNGMWGRVGTAFNSKLP